jgi:hypothetical protein
MDTLPSVPGGNFERSSWEYCAAFFCIFLAPKSSFERWLRCFFLLFCFAASSGASGTKATRMASTAAICLKKLLLMFLSWQRPYCVTGRHVCVSLLSSLSGNGPTMFSKDSYEACHLTHPSCYRLGDSYNGKGKLRALQAVPSHPQFITLHYGIHPTTTRAVALGSYTDVISI